MAGVGGLHLPFPPANRSHVNACLSHIFPTLAHTFRYTQAMAAYKASGGGAAGAAEDEEGDASEGGDE